LGGLGSASFPHVTNTWSSLAVFLFVGCGNFWVDTSGDGFPESPFPVQPPRQASDSVERGPFGWVLHIVISLAATLSSSHPSFDPFACTWNRVRGMDGQAVGRQPLGTLKVCMFIHLHVAGKLYV